MAISSESTGQVQNNLVRAVMTDMYQLTMCYAYWCNNRHQDHAVFDLYFRKNPFRGEFTIFAGLEECLKFLENYRFLERDIAYLRSIPILEHVSDKFWAYLKELDGKSIKLYALEEGSICFPNCPLMRVEGPIGLLQLIETPLLNLTNYPCLIATNAARYKMAANGGGIHNPKLLEYGLRRSQGPDGGFSASRYAFIGGFDATSNLQAGMEFGIPVSGTIGHSFISAYFNCLTQREGIQNNHKFLLNLKTTKEQDFTAAVLAVKKEFSTTVSVNRKGLDIKAERSELLAFIEFAWAMPNCFLVLVDTYDVIRSGLVNFCIVATALLRFGYKPIGIRIDSGDLAYLSRQARELFELVARVTGVDEFTKFEIIASNDINEETLHSLRDQNHSITSIGIGTHLVTCQNQPALGIVYKLVEVNGQPCMKLSSSAEKVTIPYKKSPYRLYGQDNHALIDLIMVDGEDPPEPGNKILCRHPFDSELLCYAIPARVEPLLKLCWDGQRILSQTTLHEVRQHCLKSLMLVTEDIKRSLNPTPYKVSVSEKLFRLMNDLKLKLKPIVELS